MFAHSVGPDSVSELEATLLHLVSSAAVPQKAAMDSTHMNMAVLVKLFTDFKFPSHTIFRCHERV